MKRLAIAGLAVLGLAAPASAATVLVESDKAIYSFGETIIITTILTVDGDEAPVPAINLQLVWDGSVASPGPSPSTILPVITSFTGLFPWNKGLGNCPPAGGSCLTLDYLSPTAPTPQTPDPGST